MRKIFVITSNSKKISEYKNHFSKINLKAEYKNLDIYEIKDLDQENVVIQKAISIYNLIKEPVLVDDTVVFFDGYNSFPGTYTKFLIETLGGSGIKKLLGEGRKGKIVTIVCYYDGSVKKVFKGVLNGYFNTKGGTNKKEHEYNDLFIPDGFQKGYSMFLPNEIYRFSPRSIALKKFIKFYKKLNEN